MDKLNWECINARDWKNTETNIQKQDLKQAEFLVRYHLPINLISAIVVKNDIRKIEIEELFQTAGIRIPVHIDRENKLYYP